MTIRERVQGWPSRIALLAALAAAGTGLYAWTSEADPAPAPEAAAAAPAVAPENVPFTTCPLGCEGGH